VMRHNKSLPSHAVVKKVLPTSALTRWSILLTSEMTAKFDLGPWRINRPGCWQSFAFVFRGNPSPVTIVGTEFRLAAYLRVTRSRVP
jgi:hypothetical protein